VLARARRRRLHPWVLFLSHHRRALPTTMPPGVVGPWMACRRGLGTCRAGHRRVEEPVHDLQLALHHYMLSYEQNSRLEAMTECFHFCKDVVTEC
jgi:hypothetical protein